MTYRTFNEWRSLGFGVIKGQKSYKRDAKGQAVFSSEQVKNIDALLSQQGLLALGPMPAESLMSRINQQTQAMMPNVSAEEMALLEFCEGSHEDADLEDDHWSNMRPY